LDPVLVQRVTGWEFNKRDASDWVFLSGTFMNVGVQTAWFLGTCLVGYRGVGAGRDYATLAQVKDLPEAERIPAFFALINKPVDFHAEETGGGSDNAQAKVMGLLALIYGGFIALMVLIPNPLAGRLTFAFCGGTMLVIGALLYRAGTGRRAAAATERAAEAQRLAASVR